MLPETFIESWVHGAHKVFGHSLRPYCLWHRFCLEAVESPFLAQKGQPTFGDLDLAIRICRSRYPLGGNVPYWRILGLKGVEWKLTAWARFKYDVLSRYYDLPEEGARFTAYVRDYFAPPQFWNPPMAGNAGTHNGPPEVLALAVRLMSGGFKEREAWEMPIGQAYWYAASQARQAGADIKFASESAELLTGLQRLMDLCKSGKLKFEQKGVRYTP